MPISDGIDFGVAESPLGGFLDKITAKVDAAAANRDQLRGLAAGGVVQPGAAPAPGLFAKLLGVNPDGSPLQDAPAAPAPVALNPAPALVAPGSQASADASGGGLMPIFQNAIASIESKGSGDYAAKGPVGPNGDRPFGRYQVMASNVGPWSKEILGQALTPQQFLASPQAQDAVFNGKFGQYLKQTGNPKDAASMWFTGKPLAQGAGRQDQLGTTGSAYVDKFMAALPGAKPSPSPAVASAPGAPSPAMAFNPATAPATAAAAAPAVQAISTAAPQPQPAPSDGASPDGEVSDKMPNAIAYAGGGGSGPGVPGQQPAPQQTAMKQPAAAQPAQGAGAGAANGNAPLYSSIGTPPTMDQIKALVANPATRPLGLQLWQAAVQPRAPIVVKAGETILSPATGAPVYSSPMPVKADETIINPTSGQPLFTATGNDSQVVQTGEDQFSNKVFSIFNKRTGAYTPINGPNGTTPAATTVSALSSGASGPDLLAALPPSIASQVKAIAEGRSPPPQGQAMRTPVGQQLAALVQQYDPSFEAGNAMARNKVRTDFESGPTATSITAGNTALQHLAEIDQYVGELGNLDTGIPGNNLVNTAKNAIGQSAGGAVAVNKLRSAVGDFAGELTKFYRGAGGSEADINRVLADLNPSLSPSQLRAGVQTQVQLVMGKVNALQDRWRQGMGPAVAPFPIISPTTQKALQTITGIGAHQGAVSSADAAAPQAGTGLAAQSAAPPARVNSAAEAQALPSGTTFMTPDGRIMVRH